VTGQQAGVRSVDFALEVAGARLRAQRLEPVETRPAAPTLVLLHEGLGCISMWRSFAARLVAATGCPALLYDRRGHGGSDPADRPRGPDYLHRAAFDELPAVLAACAVSSPVLVGHSDGGSIALLAASRFPLRGVVAVAAHVLVEEEALAGIRATLRRLASTDLEQRLAFHHGAKARALVAAWADTWLDPAFRGWSIADCLPAISCPVLVLQGEEDEYASSGHPRLIASGIGVSAEALLLEGCGHAPHLEAEAVVLEAVARFVDQVAEPKAVS
jgi:pimeloyl-ACP methyl ester carboxylesterase